MSLSTESAIDNKQLLDWISRVISGEKVFIKTNIDNIKHLIKLKIDYLDSKPSSIQFIINWLEIWICLLCYTTRSPFITLTSFYKHNNPYYKRDSNSDYICLDWKIIIKWMWQYMMFEMIKYLNNIREYRPIIIESTSSAHQFYIKVWERLKTWWLINWYAEIQPSMDVIYDISSGSMTRKLFLDLLDIDWTMSFPSKEVWSNYPLSVNIKMWTFEMLWLDYGNAKSTKMKN